MTLDEFRQSLTATEPPAGLSLALAGLWWDGKGDWTRAHESAQQDEGAEGSWVHAYLHRKEGVATGDAMGRLFVTIISAIAELERSLVVERVKSGMRRAKLEGRQIGRSRLDVNRQQVIDDRRSGLSLTQVAKKHSISRASVCRLMKEACSNPDAPVPALAGNMPEQASAAGAAQ
jgi:hypothetical protein